MRRRGGSRGRRPVRHRPRRLVAVARQGKLLLLLPLVRGAALVSRVMMIPFFPPFTQGNRVVVARHHLRRFDHRGWLELGPGVEHHDPIIVPAECFHGGVYVVVDTLPSKARGGFARGVDRLFAGKCGCDSRGSLLDARELAPDAGHLRPLLLRLAVRVVAVGSDEGEPGGLRVGGFRVEG